MNERLSKEDVLHLLRMNADGMGSQAALANAIGISAQYLSDILKGKREPGKTVLDFLEIERVISYKWKDQK